MQVSKLQPGLFMYRILSTLLLSSVFTVLPQETLGQEPGTGQKSSLTGGEAWKKQFKAGAVPLGVTPTPAPETGKVTYTLHTPKETTPEEEKIFAAIRAGMDRAVKYYNQHTSIRKKINVHYSPGTPTADGNINGTIRLGKNARNARVCMHEICHTVGVGTHGKWQQFLKDGQWQGKRANKVLQELTNDSKAQLKGDRMHFWPYGLNFDSEVKSDEDYLRHAKIVDAIVKDLEAAD